MPSSNKKSATKIIGHQWEFSSLWNKALHSIPSRPMVKRDHIWASELNGSYLDRYLKMFAHTQSNPPNDRSLRKFAAGHFFEWVIGMVLTCAGILKQKQLHGVVKLPGLLKVTGRLDFIAGGPVDWDKARVDVETLKKFFATSVSDMPPIVMYAIDTIITSMEKQFAKNPLEEVILEAKSVSSFMSEKLQKTNKPMEHHVLQNLHYVIANKLPGAIVYVCKDDMIAQQFRVEPSKQLLKMYKDDVANMTGWFQAAGKNYMKNLPPKEPEILFDVDMFRFSRNFLVEYSPYLTMNYSIDSPKSYQLKWSKKLSSWNRVFKRCVNGDKMTPSNLDYIKEAKAVFPEWDKYVAKAKAAGAFDKADDSEDE